MRGDRTPWMVMMRRLVSRYHVGTQRMTARQLEEMGRDNLLADAREQFDVLKANVETIVDAANRLIDSNEGGLN